MQFFSKNNSSNFLALILLFFTHSRKQLTIIAINKIIFHLWRAIKKKALSTEYSGGNVKNNNSIQQQAAKVIIYHLCDRYFNKNLFAREHTFIFILYFIIFTIHTSLWVIIYIFLCFFWC